MYLSQLLDRKVYYKGKVFGQIKDAVVLETQPNAPLSKLVIKKKGKKLTISSEAIDLKPRKAILKSIETPLLPYDENDFYLKEDLLDKQVIDTDGKRLVRVNDILLEQNGELKAIGIDIGFAGILRRLNMDALIKKQPRVLPWEMIEAFDYQTGDIKIKLTESKLNSFHPAEMADILEEVGTKERLSLLETLHPDKAALAIEEANEETQGAILEQLAESPLKTIVEKMHLSEIADIVYKLNPLRITEILKLLGSEKTETINRILTFGDNTAGGLMILDYYKTDGGISVKELYTSLNEMSIKPETVVVTNGNEKIVGTLYTRDLLNIDNLALLKDIVSDRKFTYPFVGFTQILRMFTQYNLRALPVVDKDKKPIGIITIDTVLSNIETQQEENDTL